MDVRAAVTTEKALQRGLRLARVDLIAESAGCTKRKPEELQLVRGLTRAVGKQLHAARTHFGIALRSEEHTSELQSLMRISYAVFCLKKKKLHHISNNII